MEGLQSNSTIAHAEIAIGNSIIMLADEMPGHGNQSPTTLKGTPISLAVYVEDADLVFKRAVEAGATVTMPLADQFYGDRAGSVQDPFGHKWMIMTHIEDVSPEHSKKRMAAESAKNDTEKVSQLQNYSVKGSHKIRKPIRFLMGFLLLLGGARVKFSFYFNLFLIFVLIL